MNHLALQLDQALTDALTTRDLRCVHASMRYGRKDPQAAPDGFDVTLTSTTGHGAGVTGSGPTLHDALRRAIAAFDQFVRPTIATRKEPSNGPQKRSARRTPDRPRGRALPPESREPTATT